MVQGIDFMEQHLGEQALRDRADLMDFFAQNAINGDIAIDPNKESWCAAMMNACERAAGNPGTGHLDAQSFLKYGTEVNGDDAVKGDIVIFHFPFDAVWQGHVTYFEEWEDSNNTVKCMGGNQSHAVTEAHYVQDYIVGIRRFK